MELLAAVLQWAACWFHSGGNTVYLRFTALTSICVQLKSLTIRKYMTDK
jgi:hypothetical protein